MSTSPTVQAGTNASDGEPDALCRLTATEILNGYGQREFSPVDVVQATLRRIHRLNEALGAYYCLNEEEALLSAQAAQERWHRGEPAGALDGVPLSIKDSIAVAGLPMFRGSRAYDGSPSSVDAPPTARLREAGAVILGKTTMPDFGCLASGVSSQHGIARNPWDATRTPGGSTSGGAAAVAGGLGPLTVGSDLGGSLRIPAAFCGLVAVKPTQGRVPHLPASSMRSAGPLARSVADARLMLEVLSQPDRRDYFSLPLDPAPPPTAGLLQGARIGLLLDLGWGQAADAETKHAVEQAAAVLANHGAIVQSLASPFQDDPEWAVETYFRARVLSELRSLDGERQALAHPEVVRWCTAADGMSAAELLRALSGLERMRSEVNESFHDLDFVLSPTMPTTAYAAEIAFPDPDRAWAHLLFTCAYNQTQQPALSLPCALDSAGLPIGLQIVAPRFADRRLMQFAEEVERLLGFPLQPPRL